jgi:hypothetical protein
MEEENMSGYILTLDEAHELLKRRAAEIERLRDLSARS